MTDVNSIVGVVGMEGAKSVIYTRAWIVVVTVGFMLFFFFNDTATTEIYTLSLHDALPIFTSGQCPAIMGHCPDVTLSQCAPLYDTILF